MYRRTADSGSAEAQLNFGFLFESGQGVPQDNAQAVRWYSEAADHGLVVAQWNLGLAYEKGLGVGQDYGKARYWYLQAAQGDDRNAQNGGGQFFYLVWAEFPIGSRP